MASLLGQASRAVIEATSLEVGFCRLNINLSYCCTRG